MRSCVRRQSARWRRRRAYKLRPRRPRLLPSPTYAPTAHHALPRAAKDAPPHRADNAVAPRPHTRSRGRSLSASSANFQAGASRLRGEDNGGQDGREGRTSALDESVRTHGDAYMPPPAIFALASVGFAHARASKLVIKAFGGKSGTGVAQRVRYHHADEPSRPARPFGDADDAHASTQHARSCPVSFTRARAVNAIIGEESG
ncbi:hypothetical protein C8J57DRAFT_1593496 [Mycena rebaudengoi]|nr:hypothetical protein C8J57DRAFT_1538618 [Mycena rebaudengoi]KAJ7222045.1 hypothetical protein C8J57DRAFT_1593496 [Mycena rebaudengoi]